MNWGLKIYASDTLEWCMYVVFLKFYQTDNSGHRISSTTASERVDATVSRVSLFHESQQSDQLLVAAPVRKGHENFSTGII